MKKENNKFRLKSKNFSLTYSQCSWDKQKVFDYLTNLLEQKNLEVDYLLVGQENHQDHKGIHQHVFLQLKKLFDLRNIKFFDLPIDDQIVCHPNIQRTQSIEDWTSYCKKENNFLEFGVLVKQRRYVRKNQKEEYKQIIYDEIDRLRELYRENNDLTLDEIREQLDEFIYKIDRDYFYENIKLIDEIFKRRFKKKPFDNEMKKALELKKNIPSFYNWDTFKIIPKAQEIMDFILNNIKETRPVSLVIESNTRHGKTQFILAFLNHLQIRFNYIKDSLYFGKEVYDENVDVCVFDDISLFQIINKNLLTYLIGGQSYSLVDSKYQPIRRMQRGTVNIFLCNEHNSFEQFCLENKKIGRHNWKYIRKNCHFIKLNHDEKFY